MTDKEIQIQAFQRLQTDPRAVKIRDIFYWHKDNLYRGLHDDLAALQHVIEEEIKQEQADVD